MMNIAAWLYSSPITHHSSFSMLPNDRARLVVPGRGARLVEADARDVGADKEVAAPRGVARPRADRVGVDAVTGRLSFGLGLHPEREGVAARDGRVAAQLGLEDARLDELPEGTVPPVR